MSSQASSSAGPSTSMLDDRLDVLLAGRRAKNRFRSLKEYNTAGDTTSTGLLDFSSNDYLSLTASPSLRAAYLSALASTPDILGSTGSRLLSGGTPPHAALEARFARFFGSPAALLFNSGWDANVSFFSTVPQPGDWIVHDELVHASVHSGMRASRVPPARRVGFAHNDADALRRVLRRINAQAQSQGNGKGKGKGEREGVVFLALESLYSMDGDFACLPQMLDVLDEEVPRARQCVVLDEAHSTGVYGDGGRGVAHALREDRVGVRLMTFGKAVGSSGAVLLCTPTIRSFLINFARPLIFSTALPHSTLISLSCACDTLSSTEGDARRAALTRVQNHFYALLAPILSRAGSSLALPPPSPVPFPLALRRGRGSQSDAHALALALPEDPRSPIVGLLTLRPHALSAFLLERGMVVRPVVPPTVPPGGERVRVCLRAGMRDEVLERLASALGEWVELELGGARAKL